MTELTLPSYQDIEDAAQRILGFAHKTPVLTSTTANKQFGAELFLSVKISSVWVHLNLEAHSMR